MRKGLRQIEGLLAQICLSGPVTHHRRKSSTATSALDGSANAPDGAPASPKPLRELRLDPAYREFFRLQEGFQWNGESDTAVLVAISSPWQILTDAGF